MTMSETTCVEIPEVAAVQKQFEQWRTNRTKREAIPGHLWEAAANLCKTYPITHVCRYLRLSFSQLKKRVDHVSTAKKQPVQFMEFDLSCLSGGWQLECDRADGARLRLSAGGQPPAIAEVLRQFLS
jgi:hypothetical protein